MGTLETYSLYALAIFVFLFAWKEAGAAMRRAREMQNERQMDVARGDRNFALFAGVYLAAVVAIAVKFTPRESPFNREKKNPKPTTVKSANKTLKAKSLIFDDGKLSVVDERGKLHQLKGKVEIQLSGS